MNKRGLNLTSLVTGSLLLAGVCYAKTPVGQHPQSFETEITVGEVTKTVKGNYLLHLPASYYDSEKKWPVILFLHGGGGRGDNLDRVRRQGTPRIVRELDSMPFISVAPQVPRGGEGWGGNFRSAYVDALLDELIAKYNVDESRMYITGQSMGGSGTWSILSRYPDRFTAAAPICGGGRTEDVPRVKHLPLWVFHGAKDHKVPLQRSVDMVMALKEAGAKVKFTVYPIGYPGNAHDAWTKTYTNPELYEWFLKHRRQADGKIVAQELVLDPSVNSEAWVKPLIQFRKDLLTKLRTDRGFTGIKGFDPNEGFAFSLAFRNPFAHEMGVRVGWNAGEDSPWRITTNPRKVALPAGKEVRIGFSARLKGKGKGGMFPLPICKTQYTAGEAAGSFEIELPMDIDAYLQKYRPTLAVRPATAAPEIDGKLDDPIWRRSADVVDFEREKLDRAPSVPTQAWIAYDSTFCYVAMRCGDPAMDKLKIAPPRRDGPVWKSDSVEIMLDTNRDRRDARYYQRRRGAESFFQFTIDAAGTIFDARGSDKSFNAVVKAATAREKSAWTVEIAIPWADLKVTPAGGTTKMGFLLARHHHPKGTDTAPQVETLQYPPLYGWNHRKENYGDLMLAAP